LLEGDIAVFVPVQQERGRIVCRDIVYRGKRDQARGLPFRIDSSHFPGPEAMLAIIEIDGPAFFFVP
jgi:hypothetical protein